MGLDMYLYRKVFVWTPKNLVIQGLEPQEALFDTQKVKYIIEEVAYWRKANQIHRWFVQNIQKGEDDCKTYPVDKSDLQELVNECKLVLDNPSEADKVLPTQGGFFFGDTSYSEYYLEDLKNTVKMLERVLSVKDDYGQYEYRSSW